MTFLFPQFLWALLALAPLTLVYLIKVRPRRRRTSAWFLWQGVFQERRAASWLQKLRDWLSLLLLALAFLLLVLALARPVFRRGPSAERLVMIVDNSLSMNAAGRLDEARRAAMAMARSLPAGGRASVFSLGGELVSAAGFTASRRELTRGLDTITGTDAPFNVTALHAFSGTTGSNRTHRVVLFTDGCFEGADRLPEGIELVRIGRPADNAGITAFDVQRMPGSHRPVGVFFRIFSGAQETIEADAVLSGENPVDVRRVYPVEIKPGLNDPVIDELPDGEAGRWMLTLEMDDALDRDNTAYAVVPEADPVRVAVHAPETAVFWKLCVEAFGEGVTGLVLDDAAPDLVLCRGAIGTAPAKRSAVFAPAGESLFWRSISGEAFEAAARVVLPDHPLARYADLDGVVLSGVRRVEPPAQAVVVAETDDGIPLIYQTSSGEASAFVFNFDPALNQFFLRPLFPVLVWSTASELMHLEDAPRSMIAAGAVAQLPAGFESGEVTAPDGGQLACRNGRIGPLERFGFYTVTAGTNTLTIACGGATPVETGLRAAVAGDTGAASVGGYPLSDGLLVAALLLLVLECVLYHRRRVG